MDYRLSGVSTMQYNCDMVLMKSLPFAIAGVARGSPSNNSNQAGGWGYTTGHLQGFKGTQLPPVEGGQEVWKKGSTTTKLATTNAPLQQF